MSNAVDLFDEFAVFFPYLKREEMPDIGKKRTFYFLCETFSFDTRGLLSSTCPHPKGSPYHVAFPLCFVIQ
jgi:hypothetical protein